MYNLSKLEEGSDIIEYNLSSSPIEFTIVTIDIQYLHSTAGGDFTDGKGRFSKAITV